MAKCSAHLLNHFELNNLIYGIRASRDSLDISDSDYTVVGGFKLGNKDKKLIEKCLENDEGSVFEHLVYQFKLRFPRSVLQELSRHRVGVSPTVKSTRYTLKELSGYIKKFEDTANKADFSPFYYGEYDNYLNSSLSLIARELFRGAPSDEVKQFLPEAFMSEGVYTINARALNHLFRLRNREKVYKPFRELVKCIFEQIPYSHKFIFEKSFGATSG